MQRTVLLIKPDVVHLQNEIIHIIKESGFVVLNKRDIELTKDQIIQAFQECEKDVKEDELVEYYSSGPIVVLLLSKLNGIEALKGILGIKEYEIAKQLTPDCLRLKYGTSTLKNAFHCSVDEATAEKEIRFFFPNVPVDPAIKPSVDKKFLDNSVYPVLAKGLTELCKEKPLNPVQFLGEWLLRNNPNVPKVVESLN